MISMTFIYVELEHVQLMHVIGIANQKAQPVTFMIHIKHLEAETRHLFAILTS